MKLLIDDREPADIEVLVEKAFRNLASKASNKYLKDRLEEPHEIVRQRLETGDYVILNDDDVQDAIIERKFGSDLTDSLMDGRFFSQRENMAEAKGAKFYILEGTWQTWYESLPDPLKEFVDSVVTELPYLYHCTVVFSYSLAHTAKLIARLMACLHKVPVRAPLNLGPKNQHPDAVRMYAQATGWGVELGQRAWERFSLLDICNIMICSNDEEAIRFAAEVEGIGFIKAASLVKALRDRKKSEGE